MFSDLIGRRLKIKINNKNRKIEEKFQYIWLILVSKLNLLENNFKTSAKGWNKPKIPTFLGPIRIWKIPKIFRSIIVKKAKDKNKKIKINIKFNIIKIIILMFFIFFLSIYFYNFIKFLIISEIIFIFFYLNFNLSKKLNSLRFTIYFISLIIIESRIGIILFFEIINKNKFLFVRNLFLF